MSQIEHIADDAASPQVAAIFHGAQAAMGKVPNLLRVMAQAPAVLDIYWSSRAALGQGTLPAPVRERIAIAIAAANGCDYCLSAHSGAGRAAGLSPDALADAQRGRAEDPHVAAILALALAVNASHGATDPAMLARARAAGLSDAEVLETLAHVAVNVLTNSINNMVQTTLDFPRTARVA